MFSLICAWINGCVNDDEAGDLRRHRANYDVTVMGRRGGNIDFPQHAELFCELDTEMAHAVEFLLTEDKDRYIPHSQCRHC